jgi:hypothetical protein
MGAREIGAALFWGRKSGPNLPCAGHQERLTFGHREAGDGGALRSPTPAVCRRSTQWHRTDPVAWFSTPLLHEFVALMPHLSAPITAYVLNCCFHNPAYAAVHVRRGAFLWPGRQIRSRRNVVSAYRVLHHPAHEEAMIGSSSRSRLVAWIGTPVVLFTLRSGPPAERCLQNPLGDYQRGCRYGGPWIF